MIIKKGKIIKAINDSIKHWNKDIVKPLEKGKMINKSFYGLTWGGSNLEVKIGGEYCPLCNIFGERECPGCPLHTIKTSCDLGNSPWYIFKTKPTLANARKMVAALQKINIEEIEDVKFV